MYKCLCCGAVFDEPFPGKPDPYTQWGMMHPECPECGDDCFEEIEEEDEDEDFQTVES